MEQITKRVLKRIRPEITAGYHLPKLGRVQAIRNPEKIGGFCTADEPLYCVDVQPLDDQLEDDGPVLLDLVLALNSAGNERGFFALPSPGVIVEFCFCYAMPNIIFIRGALPFGLKLPALNAEEAKWQQSSSCCIKYTKGGSWEQIGANIQQIAQISQTLKASKTWIGSDSINALKTLSEFIDLVKQTFEILATHTHTCSTGNVSPPIEAAQVTAKLSDIDSKKSDVDTVTL